MTSLAAAAAILSVLSADAPADSRRGQTQEYVRLEICGTLTTGIAAIGGETTGTLVGAKGISWELDLGAQAGLQAKADALAGQLVVVRGSLEPRGGVELRRMRLIVVVESLERAPKPAAR